MSGKLRYGFQFHDNFPGHQKVDLLSLNYVSLVNDVDRTRAGANSIAGRPQPSRPQGPKRCQQYPIRRASLW